MHKLAVFVLLFIAGAFAKHRQTYPNLRPIIGIVNEPEVDENPYRAYFAANYVWWLSAAGARIVPIPYYAPSDVLRRLFDSINGVASVS